MRIVSTVAAVGLVAALLGGCASAGNSQVATLTADQAKQDFVQGKTTQADVKKLLGDPMSVTTTQDGSTEWTYAWVHAKASGSDFIPFNFHQTGTEHTKSLVLMFDSQGLLQKYTLTDANGRYCGGIGC